MLNPLENNVVGPSRSRPIVWSFQRGMTRTTVATSRTRDFHPGRFIYNRERIAVVPAYVAEDIQDRGLLAGVPLKDTRLDWRGIRRRLPPVILDELFGDAFHAERQLRAGIIAQLHGKVRQGSSRAKLYEATNRPSSMRRWMFTRKRICSSGVGGMATVSNMVPYQVSPTGRPLGGPRHRQYASG